MSQEQNDAALLEPIADLCDGQVSFKTEGWRRLILMEGLRFKAGPRQCTMDGLLCLNHDNTTYPTKLYLTENVGCGLNWNESPYLLGRQWHTFSWSNVSQDQSPFAILAAHLAPLSKGSPS